VLIGAIEYSELLEGSDFDSFLNGMFLEDSQQPIPDDALEIDDEDVMTDAEYRRAVQRPMTRKDSEKEFLREQVIEMKQWYDKIGQPNEQEVELLRSQLNALINEKELLKETEERLHSELDHMISVHEEERDRLLQQNQFMTNQLQSIKGSMYDQVKYCYRSHIYPFII